MNIWHTETLSWGGTWQFAYCLLKRMLRVKQLNLVLFLTCSWGACRRTSRRTRPALVRRPWWLSVAPSSREISPRRGSSPPPSSWRNTAHEDIVSMYRISRDQSFSRGNAVANSERSTCRSFSESKCSRNDMPNHLAICWHFKLWQLYCFQSFKSWQLPKPMAVAKLATDLSFRYELLTANLWEFAESLTVRLSWGKIKGRFQS